jgi:hypothetical protein
VHVGGGGAITYLNIGITVQKDLMWLSLSKLADSTAAIHRIAAGVRGDARHGQQCMLIPVDDNHLENMDIITGKPCVEPRSHSLAVAYTCRVPCLL